MFDWTEKIREFLRDHSTVPVADNPIPHCNRKPVNISWHSHNRNHLDKKKLFFKAEDTEVTESFRIEIIHNEPITDRKSTFQAHGAIVNSVKEVRFLCCKFTSDHVLS